MPEFSYQKNARGLSSVLENLKDREEAAVALQKAKGEYSGLANERLQNIARGDNFNPWLTMQMFAKRNMTLDPLTAQAGLSQASGIKARDNAWEAMAKQAETAAQTGKPFKPNFNY